MNIFRHKLSVVLSAATFCAAFVDLAFFYGMLLFVITFFSYSFLVSGISTNREENSINSFNKFIFIPVFILKFSAIGVVSYYVLIVLKGNPFWYVGGFGIGLVIFVIGSLVGRTNIRPRDDSELN